MSEVSNTERSDGARLGVAALLSGGLAVATMAYGLTMPALREVGQNKTAAFAAATTPAALGSIDHCEAVAESTTAGMTAVATFTSFSPAGAEHLETAFDSFGVNRGTTFNRAQPTEITVVDALGVSRTIPAPADPPRVVQQGGTYVYETDVMVPGAFPPRQITATTDPVRVYTDGRETSSAQVAPVVSCDVTMGS